MHLKGSKNDNQKRSFIAKSAVTIPSNPMLPKPKKHHLKYIFRSKQKHHHKFSYFPEGVMSLHLSKFEL